jgi:uroporphyrinogen decarboxylase
MTSRERLLTVLHGGIPDCVPVAPDTSNMIPARLTGKPFWDMYLYNDPPIWEAYVDCVKHFNVDALVDGYIPLTFPEEIPSDRDEYERFIVFRSDMRIITQSSRIVKNTREWSPTVDVFYVADSPTWRVPVGKIGLPAVPEKYEPLEGVRETDTGPDGFRGLKDRLGDQGLLGAFVTSTSALRNERDIFDYYDHPELHERWAAERLERAEERFQRVMSMETRPDFIAVGGSGTLVFQTVDIFRQLALPAVKRIIELANAEGLPTHVHSCGPEKELVRIMADETDITVIDPLEIPPMGDCDLAELKRLYGDRIVLKGNLHTTTTMLDGSTDDVVAASRKAIDDAAENGRFILSTGDQCGRDTPDENIHAMIETARTYGRY